MAQVPASDRGRNAQAPGCAPDRRQLRHPQASQGPGLAEAACPLPHALHPDLRLLAQPGRTLLRPDHRGPHPLRRVQERCRTGGGNPAIPRPVQCRSQAFRLDRVGQLYPGEGGAWATNVRVTTLAGRPGHAAGMRMLPVKRLTFRLTLGWVPDSKGLMDHAALSQLSKDDLIALLLAQQDRIAELER